MVSEVRYHPYGQERWSNGATPTDFGFTSQRNEASFGLMDYNARYYSPVLGRFVSPDTMIQEPGQGRGFNRYRYARNNPLKYTDPSGHFIETVWDVANVAIGVGSMAYNLSQGNYTDAAIDAGGLVVDVAATIVPGVPGGASAAIKAIRAGDKGADLLRYATKADDVIEAGLKYSDEATGFIDDTIEGASNPAFKISKSDPDIGDHAKMVERAQNSGHQTTLTRGGGTREARKNRYHSQKEIRKKQGGPKNNHDYDEYPYASTQEGGAGAHIEEVLSTQNQEAGRRLGKFYTKNNIKQGDKFDVFVVD